MEMRKALEASTLPTKKLVDRQPKLRADQGAKAGYHARRSKEMEGVPLQRHLLIQHLLCTYSGHTREKNR